METLDTNPPVEQPVEGEKPAKSKKALKREKKKEKWEALKPILRKEMKQKQKQKKRERKQQEWQAKDKGEETKADDRKPEHDEHKSGPKKKRFDRDDYKKAIEEGMPVIIDCTYQDWCTDKEMISLSTQLAYCHNINKKFDKPTGLTVIGYKTRLKERLAKYNAENWGIRFLENDYLDYFARDKLVYLSGDATEEIHEIDPTKVYVIGGLVDHNRFKKATYEKGIRDGIAVKRLPIADHLTLKCSTILAVNHVFEVVARLYNGENMGDALRNTIPKRKIEELINEQKAEEIAEKNAEQKESDEKKLES